MKEPKIRFKEFKGEWETSAIGDIASFSKGRGYSKSDLQNNGYPIILYGRMYTDYSFVIDSVDTFATLQKGSVLSNGDEVVIPASGETPEDRAIASAVVMRNVILGGDLNILKFNKKEILPSFAAMQISCGKTRKELSNFAQGKTVVHLHNCNISKGHIAYPSMSEQQSIASFFTTIDAQISASTSRLTSLKQIKAASLQAMFPQEGETVPKLRFKGFEGEWEKVKVGELFCITRGYVLAMNLVSLAKNGINRYAVYSSQTKNNGLAGYYNNYLFEDCITWTTDGANAGDVNYRAGKFYCTNVCGVLINKEGYANKCIAECLNLVTKHYVSYVGNPKLMNNTMSEIEILIPPIQNEQQKISDYFTNLDRQITLQSQRLEKLKQIKAACLDKMFV